MQGIKLLRCIFHHRRVSIRIPDQKAGAAITVYYTGFSASGKAAIEYAASILRDNASADTKLTILASWERISTSGVLAQSSTTGYVSGWTIDALNPNVIYPVALARRLLVRV